MQAQATQLIGDSPLGDRLRIAAGQGGEMLAQIGCPEPSWELPEQDPGMQERVNAWIGKAQAGGTLVPGAHRFIDRLEGILAEDAVVAQAFDIEQAAVGRKADCTQLGQVVQPPADPEIVGVVDRRLGSQSPIFLVILLDPGVLVMDVQRRGHILRHHPRAKPGAGVAQYPAIKDELHLLWTAEVEVLPNHLLEEQSAMHRAVQDLGGRELALQDRDRIAIAGLAVSASEWVREHPQPFAQKSVDLGCGEAIADRLQPPGSGRAGFASCRRLDRSSVPTEPGLPEFVMNRRSEPHCPQTFLFPNRTSPMRKIPLTRPRLRPTSYTLIYPRAPTPRRSEAEPR